MYYVEVHKTIKLIFNFFYAAGIWHHSDGTVFRISKIQLFYFFFYIFYPVSLIGGAILNNDNLDEAIFSLQAGIIAIVAMIGLYYLVSQQKQILEMIDRIGVFSIRVYDDFIQYNNKFNRIMKFVTAFIFLINFINVLVTMLIPLLGSGNKLIVNIAFPLDWKNDTIAYILANAFLFIEIFITTVSFIFYLIISFLLFNCSAQYHELGKRFKSMGSQGIDQVEHNLFVEDLISAIKSHQQLNQSTDELRSLISSTVLVHIITGSLCICGSIYSLTFNINSGIEVIVHLAIMLHTTLDIFMFMYFGNEIMLSSDHLAYCLFESSWVDQTQSTKKVIIIFVELLKRPKELVVGKIYRLTLDTFTTILNSAYYMYNILKNLH